MRRIFTIGHSVHDVDHFLDLVTEHGVTAIADVRSVPSSRFTPQFNRATLPRALRTVDVRYAFLGKELGARSDDPTCYEHGQVRYERLAGTTTFADGIARLRAGMRTETIALMCAEQEPLDCHRAILVARVLTDSGVAVAHIHGDGRLETHRDAMQRLKVDLGLDRATLFDSADELLDEALSRQERRIAYVMQ